MARFLVILRQFFADLGGGGTDHGILVGVVVGFALEDLESDDALFHAVGMVFRVGLHDVAQQGLATFAGPEVRTTQDPFKLFANGVVRNPQAGPPGRAFVGLQTVPRRVRNVPLMPNSNTRKDV